MALKSKKTLIHKLEDVQEEKHVKQEKASQKSESATSGDKETPAAQTIEQQAQFFTQTYYLFLILFLMHFAFSVYLFTKFKSFEDKYFRVQNTAAVPYVNPELTQVPEAKVEKPSPAEMWRGPKDAKFVVIDYSDYESALSRTLHTDLKKLQAENNDFAWVLRHYPRSPNINAGPFAVATECAAEVSTFDNPQTSAWAMADAIFSQPAIQKYELQGVAGNLGLNEGAFQKCFEEEDTLEAVREDIAEGNRAGVKSAPTIVFYDMETGRTKTVVNAMPYDSLQNTLDEFISAQ